MSVAIQAVLCGCAVRARRGDDDAIVNAGIALHDAVAQVAEWDAGGIEATLDAAAAGRPWTVRLLAPGLALRVALFLRARLLAEPGCDVRIAIAVGPVKHSGAGAGGLADDVLAPVAACALERSARGHYLAVVLNGTPEREVSRWLAATATLIDALVANWTRRQAEVVSHAIVPSAPRYEDVARQLGVSKQAIGKALSGAGWQAIRGALQAFESSDWEAVVAPPAQPPRRGG